MNKELTPLECVEYIRKQACGNWLDEELYVIGTALKEKENIEKSINELFSENGKVITTIEIQKKLKALEIIKEKMVIPVYIVNTTNVEKYNKWLKQITFKKDYLKRRLTQEEYDLLKEVLL